MQLVNSPCGVINSKENDIVPLWYQVHTALIKNNFLNRGFSFIQGYVTLISMSEITVKKKKMITRPTVVTEAVLIQLRNAFSYGCTDEEACALAGIAPATLYNYQKLCPEFLEEKEALKLKPILAVRQAIVKGIDKDLNHARWFASKKLHKEFGDRSGLELEVGQKGFLVLPAELINKHDSTRDSKASGTGQS